METDKVTTKREKIYSNMENRKNNLIKLHKYLEKKIGTRTRFFIYAFVCALLIEVFLVACVFSNKDFFDGTIVEISGFIFDIFLFGILISSYEFILSQKKRIDDYLEEIDDYRGWEEKEASYRIFGIVKRLQKLGKKDIDLTRCYFNSIHFTSTYPYRFSFNNGVLYGTTFENCVIRDTDFSKVKGEEISDSYEQHNKPVGDVIFLNCEMNYCNFSNNTYSRYKFINGEKIQILDMTGSKFYNCEFDKIDFSKFIINDTSFHSCTFLENCVNAPNTTA